ncbi:MAG: ABC transporter ATP-binding protein [Aeromonadales bacterium]|nr:ABC transporter ATP-binding protein [Aeromonadales bacterium]MDY2891533.1 ABC transporter ATP-binding protein [Succinivibrio sp.]
MLELDHVTRKFRNTVVLRDMTFAVRDGEIVSILGPSGCGKTTLLNIILGILSPTEGRILCDGQDVTKVPMRERGFNIVFQDYALFPNLDALGNIVYGLRNRPGASTRAEVDDLIDLLDLRPHLQKRISELSGGQKQRVAIARTLVLKPRLLLLDEPLSALDGMIKESIKARIRAIARRFRLTTIIVTHDPEEALSLSDRIMILHDARIAQFAPPSEIISDPADAFVSRFICDQLRIKRENIRRIFEQSGSAA